MQMPAPFLALRAPRGEFKAVTPDDARLWVREFVDEEHGSLAFWVEALRRDLTESRGYELVDESDVRDAAGRAGRRLRCAATIEGERHGYLVAVFVIDGLVAATIRVVEFTARLAAFDAHYGAVVGALPTLRP